jgi:hypothetical protein
MRIALAAAAAALTCHHLQVLLNLPAAKELQPHHSASGRQQ